MNGPIIMGKTWMSEKGVVERVSRTERSADKSSVERWAVAAARAADSKKATDTVILEVADLLHITDLFLITSGANTRQVKTIADEVEKQVKAVGGPGPIRIEGLADAQWILMDYGDFVVHVFLEETREFYNLERLWSDAPRLEWIASHDAVNQ